MKWSHESLEAGAIIYSVSNYRVLHGRTVMAWLKECEYGWLVITPSGREIGQACSRADAMLMVMRDQENPRS